MHSVPVNYCLTKLLQAGIRFGWVITFFFFFDVDLQQAGVGFTVDDKGTA